MSLQESNKYLNEGKLFQNIVILPINLKHIKNCTQPQKPHFQFPCLHKNTMHKMNVSRAANRIAIFPIGTKGKTCSNSVVSSCNFPLNMSRAVVHESENSTGFFFRYFYPLVISRCHWSKGSCYQRSSAFKHFHTLICNYVIHTAIIFELYKGGKYAINL